MIASGYRLNLFDRTTLPQNSILMKRSPRLTPRLLAFAVGLALLAPVSAAEPKFTPLFDGKDLSQFKAEGAEPFWRIENGVLVGENDAALKGHYLWTQKEYGD